MNEKRVRDNWTWKAKDPRIWVEYGVRLLKASEWVEHGYNQRDEDGAQRPQAIALMGPMMMLKGMAIECLFKAIAVKKGHRFDTERYLVSNHDLVKLARNERVAVELDKDEETLLERLAFAVKIFGRYPMVGGEEGWKKGLYRKTSPGSEEWLSWVMWTGNDSRAVTRLSDRLIALADVELDADGLVVIGSPNP